MPAKPRLLITLGDVAGIGPEIVVRAWPELNGLCQPVVVGDAGILRRVIAQLDQAHEVAESADPNDAVPSAHRIPCIQASQQDLNAVAPGKLTAAAGRAAYDFLVAAIDWTLAGAADGIVTCPLHKEGLHAAGRNYPGHTEILAERTGSREFAMMLWARGPLVPRGLGVVHVTLHMALRDVFRSLSTAAIVEKIRLLDGVLHKLCGHRPRLAVAALNPHASDGGLFGDEERLIIGPAVDQARNDGLDVVGPLPCDTLFVRAAGGAFDGVVAMYHDQGHIALKLLSGLQAVNISLGLPIVRTSVAHGTAYDIAGKGVADHRSLVEAARVAVLLARETAERATGRRKLDAC
ncbi:MAG: 4-hydroxythreonine-4-phosphate dehydrogenase PdxA [Planctomycetes bacterium]|nr:4-hydroxythreonine-4-phosphate dehydrogenase PdxA [Planctomycetota bacterium]